MAEIGFSIKGKLFKQKLKVVICRPEKKEWTLGELIITNSTICLKYFDDRNGKIKFLKIQQTTPPKVTVIHKKSLPHIIRL